MESYPYHSYQDGGEPAYTVRKETVVAHEIEHLKCAVFIQDIWPIEVTEYTIFPFKTHI